MGVVRREERREAAFFLSRPSPEDLLVNAREVNIMTGVFLLSPCRGKPCVSVADPLGSRKRRTREEWHHVASGRRVRGYAFSVLLPLTEGEAIVGAGTEWGTNGVNTFPAYKALPKIYIYISLSLQNLNISFSQMRKGVWEMQRELGILWLQFCPHGLVAVCLGERWSRGRSRIRAEIGPETPPAPIKRSFGWPSIWPDVPQSDWHHLLSWARVRMKLNPRKFEEMSLACFGNTSVNSHVQR